MKFLKAAQIIISIFQAIIINGGFAHHLKA